MHTLKHGPTLTQPCTHHTQWHKHSNAHTYTFPQTQRSPATHTHSHPLTFTHTFVYLLWKNSKACFPTECMFMWLYWERDTFIHPRGGIIFTLLSSLIFSSGAAREWFCKMPPPLPWTTSHGTLCPLRHTSLFVALMLTQGSKTPWDFHWYPALYLTKKRWVTNYFSSID